MTVWGIDYSMGLFFVMCILGLWNAALSVGADSRKSTFFMFLIASVPLIPTGILLIILVHNPANYALYGWVRGLLFISLVFTFITTAALRKGGYQ